MKPMIKELIEREYPMQKPKHTPGPWTFTDSAIYQPGGVVPEIFDTNQKVVARAYGWCDHGPGSNRVGGPRHQERIANARLIAAAPEMLEALEALKGQFETEEADGHNRSTVLIVIDRALAKAKGVSSGK